MPCIVFLDQNAWISLARGCWQKEIYLREHEALTKVVDLVRSGSIIVPLTFVNIYETSKINDPGKRANIALAQSLISRGRVFRGRRRILSETLAAYLAEKAAITRPDPSEDWFLSDLWFEAAAEYSPETYGFEISDRVIGFIRQDPGGALFDYFTNNDEEVRCQAVRRFSENSSDLIGRIESRRALAADMPLPERKRAYGASLFIDELGFIFATARSLGLSWLTVSDIGSSLVRSIVADVPILNVERELAVRLEDQSRAIAENDLRDLSQFATVLPLADVVVAEKQFVNLSRQARLDVRYETRLFTSIFDLLASGSCL